MACAAKGGGASAAPDALDAELGELDEESGLPNKAMLVTMFHRNDAARVWQPEDIRSVNALAASVENCASSAFTSDAACRAIGARATVRGTDGRNARADAAMPSGPTKTVEQRVSCVPPGSVAQPAA